MDQTTFKKRTKDFAIGIVRLVEELPKTMAAQTLGRQLLRSATSVGANYRSACRAKSRPDFLSKLGIVEEEADESIYWLELLVEAGILKEPRARIHMIEADQLTAMVVASIRTTRSKYG